MKYEKKGNTPRKLFLLHRLSRSLLFIGWAVIFLHEQQTTAKKKQKKKNKSAHAFNGLLEFFFILLMKLLT